MGCYFGILAPSFCRAGQQQEVRGQPERCLGTHPLQCPALIRQRWHFSTMIAPEGGPLFQTPDPLGLQQHGFLPLALMACGW